MEQQRRREEAEEARRWPQQYVCIDKYFTYQRITNLTGLLQYRFSSINDSRVSTARHILTTITFRLAPVTHTVCLPHTHRSFLLRKGQLLFEDPETRSTQEVSLASASVTIAEPHTVGREHCVELTFDHTGHAKVCLGILNLECSHTAPHLLPVTACESLCDCV